MNRRNFLASLVAAVAMAPVLLRFKAELPEVTSGTWQEVVELTYQWKANGAPVGNDNTYTVTDADIGKLISVTITA